MGNALVYHPQDQYGFNLCKFRTLISPGFVSDNAFVHKPSLTLTFTFVDANMNELPVSLCTVFHFSLFTVSLFS